MNELALFAGIGGGILGGILSGFKIVCAVEIEQYCREVLLQRQRDGIFPFFPVWDDVRTFDGTKWRGIVDVITAGFPCQPFSVAGKQKADLDERNMWPSTLRIIGEVKPQWILLENVPNLLAGSHGYFGQILSDLDKIGYSARWGCLSASTVGAPHKRERLWIVATNSNFKRLAQSKLWETPCRKERDEQPPIESFLISFWTPGFGKISDIPGVDDGNARRVDRLKAVGNGQVPAVAATAWEVLSR